MSRVDSIISQIRELTESEQQELLDWIDENFSMMPCTKESMNELHQRVRDFETGVVKGIPLEEVMNRLHESVQAQRQGL